MWESAYLSSLPCSVSMPSGMMYRSLRYVPCPFLSGWYVGRYLIIGAIFVFGVKFWIEKPEFSTVNQVILVITGVFAVIFIFSLLYVFALIARFDNTIFKSVKNAVMLAVFNLRETFLLTLIHVIVIVLMIFTKGIWIFMMVGGFSVSAYINSLLFIRVFRQYEKIEGGNHDD